MKNFVQTLASNIVLGWKTTLLGLILFAATIYSVFEVDAVTWMDAILPMVLAMGLLLMPGKTKKALGDLINRKTAPFLLLPFLLIGCSSSNNTQDSSKTTVEQEVKLKSTSTTQAIISNHFKADSAKLTVSPWEMEVGKSYESASDRARVTAVLDTTGNITVASDCKGETRIDTVYLTLDNQTQAQSITNVTPAVLPEEKVSTLGWLFQNIFIPGALLLAAAFMLLICCLLLKELFLKLFSAAKPNA